MDTHHVLIIGSGPAGLTAAIYTARAGLEPLVIAGIEPGGQLMLTSEVDNFPGFPEGILGPELMQRMRAQAERFGATFIDKNIDAVNFTQEPYSVTAEGQKYTAQAVILATGASAKWLELDSETRLRGKGVSSCATCDGFFFRNKEIAVIGGGDTALEEATYLTRFASKVYLIHRRDSFRGSKAMQDKAFANPKIEIVWNKKVDEILGESKVSGVALSDTQTGKKSQLEVEGVFVAIGHHPNTDVFASEEKLVRDQHGYLITTDQTHTDIPGIFVAGDVFDHRYRQAVTAAGSGCKAAMDVETYLAEKSG